MKTVLALFVSLSLFAAVSAPVAARGTREIRVQPTAPTVQSFRLHVDGKVGPKATFWVAYGPLAGHFGLIRLRLAGPGLYAAAVRLPGSGTSEFAYLRGNGVIRTPHGAAPGNPVTTIRVLGPVTVPQSRLPTVQWQAPVG
jgi:hypothetical protein